MIRFKIRTKTMIGAMALMALSAFNFRVLAQGAEPLKLETVDVLTSGQQVQLKLHLSGPAPEPLPFTIDKPARIALDLPNTTLALASRRIDVHSGGVDSVLAAEANGRTRIVVNVDALLPYTTKIQGNDIIVTLGQQLRDAAGAAAAVSRAAGSGGSAPVERTIKTIDFRRGSDGTGRVIVQLSDPRTPVNVRQEGNQVVVDFAGTLMPKNLMRRYDVMDFATPVQTVDAIRVEGSSRLVISAQGDFEQLAYQSDNQYTVEIKPSLKRAARRKRRSNRRASDAELPGHRCPFGIAASGRYQRPEHRGQRFGDRQFDPAAAERPLGSGPRHRAAHQGPGQAPPGQCDHHRSDRGTRRPREGRAGRAQGSSRALPIRSEFMTVNYAKVSDLAQDDPADRRRRRRRRRQELAAVRTRQHPIDERTNTLLVQDTAENLAEIRRLVQTLDVPVKQVLIEARIVVVSDTFERDLGAQFGVTTAQKNGNSGLLAVSGTGTGADTLVQTALGPPPAVPRSGANHGSLARDPCAGQPVHGQYARREHQRQHRRVAARRQLPGGSGAVRRGERGQERDDFLAARHHREPEAGHHHAGCRDSLPGIGIERRHHHAVQGRRAVAQGHAADHAGQPGDPGSRRARRHGRSAGDERHRRHRCPRSTPAQIQTQVLVSDGQTVVLGGILETTKSYSANKVPWLGDIPVLGNLFKSTTNINNKTELLIFITPKILREGSNLY